MKTFNLLNTIDEESQTRNWRDMQEATKFSVWTPSTTDITNVGSALGYYQLYGPLVYYYIYLRSVGDINGTAAHMAPGATPRITNPPFGPQSASGLKTSPTVQWLDCIDSTGTDLVAGQRAQVTTLGGASLIYLANGAAWTGKSKIYIYGWIYRD